MEKPSRFLASELSNFAAARVPVGCVAHILTQSVGYEYTSADGVVRVVRSEDGGRGRSYWQKHCKTTDVAAHMGAQLCTLPGFAEPDCLFMHREVWRLSR